MSKKKSSPGRKAGSRSKGAVKQRGTVEEVEYGAKAMDSPAARIEELPDSIAGIMKALGERMPSVIFKTVEARSAAVESNLGDTQTLRVFLAQAGWS